MRVSEDFDEFHLLRNLIRLVYSKYLFLTEELTQSREELTQSCFKLLEQLNKLAAEPDSAQNKELITDALRPTFLERSQKIAGTREDYFFNPTSPANQLYYQTVKWLIDLDLTPVSSVAKPYEILVPEMASFEDVMGVFLDGKINNLSVCFRSRRNFIHSYLELMREAQVNVSNRKYRLEDIWINAQNKYVLSGEDLDMLEARSEELQNFVQLTRKLDSLSRVTEGRLIEEYDCYKQIDKLKVGLQDGSVKGQQGGTEREASAPAYVALVNFIEWFDRQPDTIRKRLRDLEENSFCPRSLGNVIDTLRKGPENNSLIQRVTNIRRFCVDLTQRDLDNILSANADKLKTLSEQLVGDCLPKIDQEIAAVREEISEFPINSVQSRLEKDLCCHQPLPKEERELQPCVEEMREAELCKFFMKAYHERLSKDQSTGFFRFFRRSRLLMLKKNPDDLTLQQILKHAIHTGGKRTRTFSVLLELGWLDKGKKCTLNNSVFKEKFNGVVAMRKQAVSCARPEPSIAIYGK